MLQWGQITAAVFCVALASYANPAGAAEQPSGAAILQDLNGFNELGSVLYVAAHPDDENTQLITYLAHGRHYRTAYLSLTRGDGGQNVLGPEFGDLLGVIRTQELLAARRIDGGIQFFSRARDFGYSKDYLQTLTRWDRQQVLSDIARVIREFRPDVVITRFSTLPGTTHGHHTASAVLALEAFKLSGDPAAFPDQLNQLTPWQPKRILLNGFIAGTRRPDQLVPGATNPSDKMDALRIDISGSDPALGVSFGQLAARSRSMHKTQGFGNFGAGGGGSGPRYESFQLLDGQPATKDILDGVDTTWNRFTGGADIGKLTDQAITQFNPQNPSADIPALLEIRSKLAAMNSDPVIDEKKKQLDHIIQECLGLTIQTTVPHAEVVPGEMLALHHTVVVTSNVPVKWLALRYPSVRHDFLDPVELKANLPSACDETETLPANTALSEPYWLRQDGTPGMFRVDDPNLIGRPENPPVFPIEMVFDVGGQSLVLSDEPVSVTTDPKKDEVRRRLDVIAPVALQFASDVQLFSPNSDHSVIVQAEAFRANTAGTLKLDAPAGWKIEPDSEPFNLAAVGDRAKLTFTITAPPHSESAAITAEAQIDGATFSTGRLVIDYPHIPLQLLQPPARLKAVSLDLAIRGHQVGYLPGAGDSTAESLAQMGYSVITLTGADLTPEKLNSLDAVVIGIRAFNVRTDLADHIQVLFDYVEAGGNLIVQYNTPTGLKTSKLGPYDIQLSRDLPHNRVTDERSPVTFLVPDSPVFNTPNKITASDLDGWVQERGLNFPSEWDTTHYTALLACNDPGEAPLKSGLLVATFGKGHFVYTGLSFFRQLPAGVPGAFRLFANLVSLGK